MNDTTKWIMIILLLLLIGAAVFMLLRSPGKDDGTDEREVAAARGDADRDGVPDARERRVEPSTGDRGVYDQEADTAGRAGAAHAATGAEPAVAHPDHPVADRDHPVADRDDTVVDRDAHLDDRDAHAGDDTDEVPSTAPVETADYDDTTTTPVEVPGTHVDDETGRAADTQEAPAAGWDEPAGTGTAPTTSGESTAEVHPLTDDEITEGGSDEPLTSGEQEPWTGTEETGTTPRDPGGDAPGSTSPVDRDGPDMTAAAAAGAAGAAGAAAAARSQDRQDDAGYQQDTLYADDTAGQDEAAPRDTGRGGADEHPVGEESTTYRAAQGEAVVVDDDRAQEAPGWTDTHAGPDTAQESDTAQQSGTTQESGTTTGWDAPADSGTAAPRTADEIVEDRQAPATDGAATAPVFTEAAYGPGSAEPLEDGTGPAGWEIKGNIGSMLFHTPESPSYDAVRAEVWFESEEAARTAGFAHWDRRRR